MIFNIKGMNLNVVVLDISKLVRLIVFFIENINFVEDKKNVFWSFFGL